MTVHPWGYGFRLTIDDTRPVPVPEDAPDFQDRCEAACERKPGQGPIERMRELVQDLMRRHVGDEVTQAALLAIEAFHLAQVEELLQEGQ